MITLAEILIPMHFKRNGENLRSVTNQRPKVGISSFYLYVYFSRNPHFNSTADNNKQNERIKRSMKNCQQ